MQSRTLTVRLHDPIASEDDLLDSILQGFGVISPRDAGARRSSGITTTDLHDALHRFLLGLVPINARAVLVLDDEEALTEPVQERIRRLAELEADGRPLLEVVTGDREASQFEDARWFRVPLLAGIVVALIASALGAGLAALVYERFGF